MSFMFVFLTIFWLSNIWIHQNYTEIEIDEALEQIANIPKKHFVLGFHPIVAREHSDYAVV